MSCSWKRLNLRFEAVQELSRGGTSSVYLSRDDHSAGKLTALKVFPFESTESWNSVRREFEVLRKICHPRIAEVHTLGRADVVELADGRKLCRSLGGESAPPGPADTSLQRVPVPGDVFLAFEYVDGLNLRETFLRFFPSDTDGTSPGRWRGFYEAIAAILAGLEVIHSSGLVHHDIKPENLLFLPLREGAGRSGPPRFDVKIIDFGVSREETTPQGHRVKGTVPYIAPEALTSSFVDGRGDLYSLGVSLVYAISGTFPFPVDSLDSWMRSIRRDTALPLEAVLPDVPAELLDLLRGLTMPDPDRRFSSCGEALEVLEKMGARPLKRDWRPPRSRIPTIGWERPLEILRNELEAIQLGESAHSLVLVDADEELFPHPFVREIDVLAAVFDTEYGRGRAQHPAERPFQVLAESIQQLIERVQMPPSRFRRLLGPLLPLIPELRQGRTDFQRAPLTPREAQLQLAEVMADLLRQLARERPVLLVLEDLHFADRDTLVLLDLLARRLHTTHRETDAALEVEAIPPHPPGSPESSDLSGRVKRGPSAHQVLLVGIYRKARPRFASASRLEEDSSLIAVEDSQLAVLKERDFCLNLKLEALDRDRLSEWLGRRHPGVALAERVLRKLHEASGGMPRFLDEIVESLGPRRLASAAGDLPPDLELPAAATADGSDLTFRIPGSLEEILLERTREVAPREREILELLAACGSPLPVKTLSELLDGPGRVAAVRQGLVRLEEIGVVDARPGPRGLEASWASESARHQFQASIPPARLCELHSRIFRVLRARSGEGSSEAAAFHARRAGSLTDYIQCALAAARRFLEAHSTRTAARLLEELHHQLSLMSDADVSPGRIRIDPEREESFQSLEELRGGVLKKLGNLYRSSQKYSRALEKFTVLLSLQERQTDLARRSELYRLTGEIYEENGDHVNALHFLEKSWRLVENQPAPQERVLALLSLSRFHHRRGDLDESESAARRALDILGHHEEGDLYARLCLQLGAIFLKRNDHARSLSYNLKALEAARGTGDMVQALEITEALGDTYTSRGEYDRALEYFTRAMELATLLGSRRTLARIYNHVGTIHFNRASHLLARENFQKSLLLWQEIEDRRGIANSLNNIGLSLCLKDDLTRAADCHRRAIEIFTRIGDEYGQAAGMNNLALIHELQGKYQEALEYAFRSLEKRKRFQSKSGMAFSYYRIGRIYQARGELDRALNYAEKALHLRREIGEKMGLAYSRVQLADLLQLRGQIESALRKCEEGEREFDLLENPYGCLIARETRARILMQAGDLESAAKLLEEVLSRARQGHQQLIAGKAVLNLARISVEKEEFGEAEQRLERARTIFQENHNRRELAELFLLKSRLAFDRGQHDISSSCLERAYTYLEELGIRDLVPQYFLLRGLLEVEADPADPARGKKFLERALLEAREACLPEIEWQVEYRLGMLDRRARHVEGARDHFEKAREVLEAQAGTLPPSKRKLFYQPRERRELVALSVPPSEDRGSRPTLPPGPQEGRTPGSRDAIRAGGSRPGGESSELEELKALNRKLLKLQEISKAVNRELDLNRLLEKIIDVVLDLVAGERGFLILKVAGAERQESIPVARNIDGKTVTNPESEISHSISARVLETGAPVLTTDAIGDDRFSASRSVRDLRLLSVLCVPLRSHDEILGAIYIDNRHRRHAFSEADLQILESFSDQVTTAITNAKLSVELQHSNRELTEVNRQMETLNRRLLREVRQRTSELQMARENMQQKLSLYESHLRFQNIVGKSRAMQEIFQMLERVAPTGLPVLIEGESGTGKELIARAIHANSTRKDHKFISENCAALSDSLLESELFGHTRGAFTGATSDRKGLFEIASGGTLFLDEVGDMSLAMQKKLLRVLEEGELRRVGGKDTVTIDVRIITASNRKLRQLVEDGAFREDLYYRLNGVRIELPPLRKRRGDIPLLVQHFLEEIAKESNLSVKAVAPAALRAITGHSWPGNVRELKHFLERTVLLMEGDVLGGEDCHFESADDTESGRDAESGLLVDLRQLPLRQARDRFVKFYVERCYLENGLNVTRAARACGMSRESFHRFLKKYEIRREGEEDNGGGSPRTSAEDGLAS